MYNKCHVTAPYTTITPELKSGDFDRCVEIEVTLIEASNKVYILSFTSCVSRVLQSRCIYCSLTF